MLEHLYTSQIGKTKLSTSYTIKTMHFLVGTKVMRWFLEMGGVWGCFKNSFVKPHQATPHFKGLEKIW